MSRLHTKVLSLAITLVAIYPHNALSQEPHETPVEHYTDYYIEESYYDDPSIYDEYEYESSAIETASYDALPAEAPDYESENYVDSTSMHDAYAETSTTTSAPSYDASPVETPEPEEEEDVDCYEYIERESENLVEYDYCESDRVYCVMRFWHGPAEESEKDGCHQTKDSYTYEETCYDVVRTGLLEFSHKVTSKTELVDCTSSGELCPIEYTTPFFKGIIPIGRKTGVLQNSTLATITTEVADGTTESLSLVMNTFFEKHVERHEEEYMGYQWLGDMFSTGGESEDDFYSSCFTEEEES